MKILRALILLLVAGALRHNPQEPLVIHATPRLAPPWVGIAIAPSVDLREHFYLDLIKSTP